MRLSWIVRQRQAAVQSDDEPAAGTAGSRHGNAPPGRPRAKPLAPFEPRLTRATSGMLIHAK